ncbi:SHC transforming protein 3 [Echinococcus multilocularis]|uniref:SHC transforming protein 3 n=1 Tax=Echinococcus multilocularis TaxID=6211 RepID=A0A068YL81_ECHMU|nr:SHC transforming protein 3 [Echinococcus multilocularis]
MNDSSILATYPIQYIGCIPITISIKSLNFQERTQITRECIIRVCEDVGLRIPPVKPPSTKGLFKFIGKGTDLTWTRQSVRLSISVEGVTVQDFHSDQVLFHHRLNTISFASSGEADMTDFVSYVAKVEDAVEGRTEGAANGEGVGGSGVRRCYVFYCSGGCSHDFIASIGEAFKLGYKGFKRSQLHQDPHPLPPRPVIDDLDPPLPEAPAPPVPADPWFAPQGTAATLGGQGFEDQFDDSAWLLQEHRAPVAGGAQEQWVAFAPAQQGPPQPVQESVKEEGGEWRSLEPVGEPWYVGQVTRQKAESLLQYDGDFLVRASTQQPNQFVLSGMQNGKKRHLLLVNPEGQVRTKDRVFSSIQELIDFHLRSTTPIRSADSELKLVFPVSPNCLDQ